MRLDNIKQKITQLKKDGPVKRVIPVSWWKLIPGLALIGLGIWVGSFYLEDTSVMLFGVIASLAIAGGGLLAYTSIKSAEVGFSFTKDGKKKTGDENAFVWIARRDEKTGKDVPVELKVCAIKKPPKGARLHYFKNFKKHFYELRNDTKTGELIPFHLPDKIPFPPELFKIPAAMQTYKDAIEYSPPTLMQKLAPGMILLAMGVVGLLMVMTTGG